VFHGFHNYRSGAMAKRSAAMLSTPRRSMPAPPAWAWHPAPFCMRSASHFDACIWGAALNRSGVRHLRRDVVLTVGISQGTCRVQWAERFE